MNKRLLKHFVLCIIATLLFGCNDSESQLLEPKVYFENKEYILEIEEEASITYDLHTRVSSMCSTPVEISYTIADSTVIDEYNKKNGTNHGFFKLSDAVLNGEAVTIPGNKIYSERSVLQLSNLDKIKEGNSYILPIRIKSSSLPVIDGSDILYFIISKPVRILKAARFTIHSVKVPFPAGSPFKSLTYEALIKIERLGGNNTIMGCEGVLIFRIGDLALPGGANNLIQIAGYRQFHATEKFIPKKWYHVAFTYDQPSGNATIYIDGKKAAGATWDTPFFDLISDGGGFFVGKVAGFMWGERPFNGYMSEVRIWNTSRTEKQINRYMLGVDPDTDGLAVYYKFDGTDQYQNESLWYIKDASGHHMDGLVNGGKKDIKIEDLEEPIKIK